ncbi:hypothetical protein E6P09_13345 [Haloferax mediterranei ATCC 33500]|uniref:Uncharacterized protein n=1 Tax=Haloferax mediterranei (strain ATCC 33500 / DSM 1411 / JCM 8866 / NBRC 14739 / NCIMB 2177 / R-4) TaxID=523841 RepID=I3R805_HALMT|nr:hypothetical protein [Haloferax mediterranei]AFK20365.1 hypothetical protein HFX_2687 [Haloferax mediterranei ATCC 33500]AHZ23730.1 hypothetical protein BM92_14245 [Haloferax mediterranei ATCC 33500]ELZ99220.1 hypothetical protein C439_15214 [Haloferax mediterranei ATCC 33500]MDX5986880.1 hypothetical protein [Haloferax mediterranei ATCC 33500]QCQ76204.1 hypothetical protein E6P09_13345 [Haloferax mediterranei ATCC 33500]
MKRRTLGIVVVVVLLVVAAIGGGLWAFGRLSFLDSYGSQYDYSVRISADEQISNVTILVPLPVANNSSPIGDTVESREYLVPETWTYDVVETQYGPMLRVRADEIPAEPTYHRAVVENDRLVRWEQIPEREYSRNDSDTLRVEHDAVDLNADATVNRSIDTRSPEGAEPLFHPRANSQRVPCEWPREDDETRCYSYDTMLFLQYDGPETTNVSVNVELYGTNSWWVGGWNYNEYSDRIHAYDIPADRQGWVVVDGELQTGAGNYPRNPPQ